MKDDSSKQNDKCKAKTKDFSLLFISLFAFIFIGLGGVLLISKINNGRINNPATKPPAEEENNGAVKKFEDYAELKEFMEKGIADINNYDNYLGGMNVFEERMDVSFKSTGETQMWGSESAPSSVPINNEIGGGGGDYSTTNVQIAGVDEGDIIKTDGKYIYTVVGNEVVIIDAYPAENAKELSRIKLDSNPNGIYINGDKLAVYGQNYNIYDNIKYTDILPLRRNSYSFLKVYDISDKEKPVLKRNFDFEGSLVNSRMIGDYIYSIISTSQYSYDEKFPVPIVIENGEVLSSDKSVSKCNCPDVYYFDIPYQSYNFTTVSSLNISDDNGKINSEVYLLDGYQNNLFVSESNAYITFNKRVSEEELTMDIIMDMFKEFIYPEVSKLDKEKIAKIEEADNDILSSMEKYQKIILIIAKYETVFEGREDEFQQEMEKRIKEKYEDISKELEKTVIHKIEINNGELKYKTSGEVTGAVLNQFSMDESGGYFRIATTKNRTWSSLIDDENRESYSNLYILDEDMKVVGKVEELAKGERIYSVRFMQNRAYMVTFKQTDPLFVIGLDDPTNPEVLGELKVPGFSSYLHPYDETTLIGLGKESDENGRITGGIKLSLFDVSDVANPKEIDKYVLGDRNSNSIAIDEHKAFLFSKEKNLLVIPVSMQGNGAQIQEGITLEENMKIMPPIVKKYFNGVAVFNVSKKGFEFKGKIDHSDEDISYSWNNVSRSLYIEDVLYSLSNKYLKANLLDTLDEVKNIELNSTNNNGPRPIPMSEPMIRTLE